LDKPTQYIGRFAPSPTGLLHAGSLVAALASWLDARAHQGRWLIRIEDIDTPRCVPGADQAILQQLRACGLESDAPVLWQSGRTALYQAALNTLIASQHAYPCACSRKDIQHVLQLRGVMLPRHSETIYPGTCRNGLRGQIGRAWRLRVPQPCILDWHDRRLGVQHQDIEQAVGDFVLLRADQLFAYQLAVVVDDAAQGVTHVVRGEDLADNTARQILLQQYLGYPTPRYLHTPLVRNAAGEKLSKQSGAKPIDTSTPEASWHTLLQAARVLDLSPPENSDNNGFDPHATISLALQHWTAAWQQRYQDYEH
jgi:glutamyl-Q tRNA(Asp) synthetase